MLDLTYETPKPKVIAGAKQDWELVIGLEVHAQVATRSKLFSGASTLFGAERGRGHARHAARHQRGMRGPSRAHRPRPEGRHQPVLRV